jgi:hypothetical protein
MIETGKLPADADKLTLEQLEQVLAAKVKQSESLGRFQELQQRLVKFRIPVKHIRQSNGREWYPKPVAVVFR